MWSLPDINSLNARAAASASKIKRAARRGPGKRQQCEYYGCNRCAVESVPWFDVFSDDPKGLIHVCSEHPADSVGEMFTCENCQRLMVENYTWERYAIDIDGLTLCLKCAAEQYFEDDTNWIAPGQVQVVTLDPAGEMSLFNPRTGVLNFARCRHVLGNSQPLPGGIIFRENFEFDSTDGRQISGRDPLEAIRKLAETFCPVLDTGWQFAVSIGLYLRNPAAEQREAA